ncbi:MAG TPA: hypothetical protein VM536_17905 [Chloroflexia bacterium]|nr:hypothetical protein [Chloroflexia bacterium]
MQKWEYCFVNTYSANGQQKPKSVNGRILENWESGPSFYDYCGGLGDEGWELVNFNWLSYSGIMTFELVFKRPKPDLA